MEPTIPLGSRVTAGTPAPRLGEVVVAHPPINYAVYKCGRRRHVISAGGAACDVSTRKEERDVYEIKRIVAGPGDEMYIREGHVYRKAKGTTRFVREHDPYIRSCSPHPDCNFPIPITIPLGQWFLMGDNRGESDDSRFWGPVPSSWIVGTVTAVHKPAF
jgi:signal peptidase I